jgi:phosphohistidine phosphatase
MQLLIVRHGDAEPIASRDSLRNLTRRGRDMTNELGAAIVQRGFAPAQIWASPYLRAQQTAQILQGYFPTVLGVCEHPHVTPDGDVHACVDWLQKQEPDKALMIVSHQPFVTKLITSLCEGTFARDAMVPVLTTSSAVLLSLDAVDVGCAHLVWQLFPPTF